MRFNWKRAAFAAGLAITSFALGQSYTHGEPVCRTAHYIESTPNTPSTLKAGYVYKVQGDAVQTYTCN